VRLVEQSSAHTRDVRAIVADAQARLERAGVRGARLDAEIILANACEVDRTAITAGIVEVSADALARFEAMLSRRERREPVAYIIGHKEFFSIEFEVTRAVLIPRPETETLVAAAIDGLAHRRSPRVLDIGTGTGAIAIAIAANVPGASVTATDISPDALEIARLNAARLKVHLELIEADVFTVANCSELGAFDLIVSNPPYVAAADIEALDPDLRDYEPRIALGIDADEFAIYRRIAHGASAHLRPGGELMVEIGAEMKPGVTEIFATAGLIDVRAIRDLAGIDRVICARRAER
jgi:release factor glutamine methyltransferase